MKPDLKKKFAKRGIYMKIYSVNDAEFKQFGRVIALDTDELIRAAEKIALPEEGSLYEPSVAEFEGLAVKNTIKDNFFGGLPAQLGYCWGHNSCLNALEWHTCSEINVGVTDLILLLGDVRDIEPGNKYNSERVMAFKLKKGEAIEVYATTLHFCPIEVSEDGFGCIVGLLEGTNTPLEAPAENKLIFRKNKWLIAHNDNKALIDRGACAGIYGPNHKICGE